MLVVVDMDEDTCAFVYTFTCFSCILTLPDSESLYGKWGVSDIRGCALTAEILSNPPHSLIDPKRTIIRGGSAGGFIVLASLVAYPNTFSAGTCMFGISDLKKLNDRTHKFQSKSVERLMGGTYLQIPEVYRARSPAFHADKIKAPLLVSAIRFHAGKIVRLYVDRARFVGCCRSTRASGRHRHYYQSQ